nr:unnamed protein product [Callosobruchus analis]
MIDNKKPFKIKLLNMIVLDFVMLTFTIVVVLVGAMMAILVGLVLPKDYTDEEEAYNLPYEPRSDLERGDGIVGHEWNAPAYLSFVNGKRLEGDISTYPWLVSISIQKYDDQPRSIEFRCTGTAVTKDTVISGGDCFTDLPQDLPAERFIIRKNSNYFWKGGVSCSVKSYNRLPGFKNERKSNYIFKISNMTFDETVPLLFGLAETYIASLSNMACLGWGGEMAPRKDILSYSTFFVDKWSKEYKSVCEGLLLCNEISEYSKSIEGVDIDDMCCREGFLNYEDTFSKHAVLNGRPLIASGILVGMQYNTEMLSDFKYYTHFLSLSKEPWLAGGLQAERRITPKFSYPVERKRPILLYSPTSTKLFRLTWLRYRNSNRER